MNGLALCAGIGGFDLGLRLALGDGYRTVCYVERAEYCVDVLRARISDGFLDDAPIWDDVRTFDGRPWRGVVDLVTAGYPCQPWSVAGKRRGTEDERWLWPEIARIIDECRPALVFLENVSVDALRPAGDDLRGLGFEVPPPLRAAAASVGAPFLRRRFFLLANAHVDHERRGNERKRSITTGSDEAPSDGHRPRPQGKGLGWRTASGTWWAAEPDVARLVPGVPHRMDRIKALGNAIVPAVVALAWRKLTTLDRGDSAC